MPVLGDLARKAFTINRPVSFSGVNGLIDHADASAITGNGALRVAAVWIANTTIADEVSTLTTRIVRRGDTTRTPVQPAEIRPLWDRMANPQQMRQTWLATNSISLTMHGAALDMLNWNAAGELTEIWPIDPLTACIERTDERGLKLVSPRGELNNHPGRRPEFMFIPLYQLAGSIDPVSPVRIAAELLGLGAQYSQQAANLARSGFRPSAVLTAGEPIPAEESEKLSARLSRLHGGGNAGGVAVVGGSNLKLEPFAMSMVDAQFIAQWEHVFDVTMALWRMPATVAGMVNKPSTWGTGIAEFSRGLERFTIRPIVQRLQAGFEAFVTQWADPDYQYRFVFDSMLSASPVERATAQGNALMRGTTSVERILAQNDEAPFNEDETVFSQLSLATAEDRELDRLRRRAETYSALVRSGVTPEAAALATGFDNLDHGGNDGVRTDDPNGAG